MFHVKHWLEQDLARRLDALAAEDLLRSPPIAPFDGVLSYASNDYLGLADEPVPPPPGAEAVAVTGAGAGAARLVTGERAVFAALEERLAGLVGRPSALLFSSGYAANVGALSALVSRGDFVVSDALNHASLIDGLRLARAEVFVAPHVDLEAVDRALAEAPRDRRRWVVTESYFSMDADGPDLRRLEAIARRHDAALYVDEAHAVGLFGAGRGLCHEAGVTPDVVMGALGKCFGAAGAFVTGSPALRLYLWNRARSFVFSTGTSPLLAQAALANVERSVAEPWRREKVLALAETFRRALRAHGVTALGRGPIVPCVVGSAADAVRAMQFLADRGVRAQAIRPPTVPAGTSRLRLTVTARHEEAALRDVAKLVGEALS